jgi:hypothetical protein
MRLWALDEVDAELVRYTVGVGQHSRTDILKHLVAGGVHLPILLADDDISITLSDLSRLITTASEYHLHIAQPAHADSSIATYPFCRRQTTLGRQTSFVEIGPMVFIDHDVALSALLKGRGMGWGTELAWYRAYVNGMRLGIVDSVQIVHHGQVAKMYNFGAEEKILRNTLQPFGLRSVLPLQDLVKRWT